MNENANSGKLGVMVATYVVIFLVGGACGYFLNTAMKGAASTATNQPGQGQFGQGNFGSGTGNRPSFAGRGGRAQGEVTAVNGNTITIKNTMSGTTETVTISDSTTYKQTDASTKDKVTVGSTISVTGAASDTSDSSAGVTATAITIQ